MSDMEKAGGGPLTVMIAGREVKLAELSFNDRRELIREHRKVERQQLKDLLTETGMPPDQQFVELRAFDKEPVGGPAWANFFNSDDGKAKILARSIEKLQQGQGQSLADQIDWDADEVLKNCAYVCHIALQPIAEGASGNPQAAPLGYGQ